MLSNETTNGRIPHDDSERILCQLVSMWQLRITTMPIERTLDCARALGFEVSRSLCFPTAAVGAPMDAAAAAAAIGHLIGQLDGGPDVIKNLADRKKALEAEKKQVQKEVQKERRKRKQVLEKTKCLTDDDLVAELAKRARGRAAAHG